MCRVNCGLAVPDFCAASIAVDVGALRHAGGFKFGLQRAVYGRLPEARAAFALALFQRGVAAVEFVQQFCGIRRVVRALEKAGSGHGGRAGGAAG